VEIQPLTRRQDNQSAARVSLLLKFKVATEFSLFVGFISAPIGAFLVGFRTERFGFTVAFDLPAAPGLRRDRHPHARGPEISGIHGEPSSRPANQWNRTTGDGSSDVKHRRWWHRW
jgi:hypothetical protein